MTVQRFVLVFVFLTGLFLRGAGVQAQQITGVGSTFAAPLYQRWAQEYRDATGVEINYQPLGSGAGIKFIVTHFADFGASDAPMNEADMREGPGIVHVPTVAGPVVVAYNIPGVGPGIRLTGDVVADIFLGKITNWDDKRITGLNPGTHFPSLAISVFHRSDSSGTTSVFTHFLDTVSPAWKTQVDAGKSVPWPVGTGAKGNMGVGVAVKGQPGSIGYVEIEFAIQQVIFYAAIRNLGGHFVYPDAAAQIATVAGAVLPPDLRLSLIPTSAPNGYPIMGFTYILVYATGTKPAVKDFLRWALTKGQRDAAELGYVPLPPNIQKRSLAVVTALK